MPEDINLLPQQQAEEQPQSKSHKTLNLISMLVLIITVVVAVGAVTFKVALAAQTASLDSKIAGQKQDVNKYHDQEGTYLLLQNKLAHAQKFLGTQNHYSRFLAALQSAVPQSVSFQALTVDKTKAVTINAVTTSYSDISGFLAKLQTVSAKSMSQGTSAEPFFTNPSISTINRNAQTGQITFTVKFTIAPALLAAPAEGAK